MHPAEESRRNSTPGAYSHYDTHVRQHGRARDAGEEIMADAGALRGPAVAGHAGAVVQHVGDVQLHAAVHPRESASLPRPRSTSCILTSLFLCRRSSERNAAGASETEAEDRRRS